MHTYTTWPPNSSFRLGSAPSARRRPLSCLYLRLLLDHVFGHYGVWGGVYRGSLVYAH